MHFKSCGVLSPPALLKSSLVEKGGSGKKRGRGNKKGKILLFLRTNKNTRYQPLFHIFIPLFLTHFRGLSVPVWPMESAGYSVPVLQLILESVLSRFYFI